MKGRSVWAGVTRGLQVAGVMFTGRRKRLIFNDLTLNELWFNNPPLMSNIDLHELRTELQRKVEAIHVLLGDGEGRSNSQNRGGMSPAGRARIAAAQRARWAKLRSAGSAKPAKAGRRRMSAAARARLSAIARIRWKKAKAAGKSAL
jgi:hypothetical protein